MPVKEFPKHNTSFFAGLGASLVAIGLGIGSGEFILWPYLSAKHGFGILWAAVVGIAFQVFLNIEIQRYAAVTGKSAVAGFLKVSRLFSFWLLFSTLAGFGWPGFASSSSFLLSHIYSDKPFVWLPYVLLIAAVLLLVVGRNAYARIERFFRYVLPLSFAFVFFLVWYYFDAGVFQDLLKGLLGQGNGYFWLPKNIDIAVLLGAFAYAGSGGNLLLGQGYYILAKKHGMASYGDTANHLPAETDKSARHFNGLRRFIIIENILVFGAMGLVTILGLSYLGPVLLGTAEGLGNNLQFLVLEANKIALDLGWWGRSAFLLSGAVALFSVQLGVFDTLGRISTDIASTKKEFWYKASIIFQGVFGVAVFALGIREPLWLITIGAVCNALAMAVISFAVLWMNSTHLPKLYRPKIWEQIFLFLVGSIYTVFFIVTVVTKLS